MALFSSKTKKKKFRYKITVKGVKISQHTTLAAAKKAKGSNRYKKIVPIGKTYRKRY
jgi:hypothetical protein